MPNLRQVTGDITTGGGVFSHMVSTGLEWIPDADTALSLDLDYYYNRSGAKVPSNLVMELLGDNDTLTNDATNRLASIAFARFNHRWDILWAMYSDESSPFNTVNTTERFQHGKVTFTGGTTTNAKTGTETLTVSGVITEEESYDANNPYMITREKKGKFTDTTNAKTTRTGTQEEEESFPVERKSTQKTTGGYNDTDTTVNTRTGLQKVTNKGTTLTEAFGFNSSSPVEQSQVGPADSTTGITEETTFGENGLKDTKSGGIHRIYDNGGLVTETKEEGKRKVAMTFGQDGLKDTTNSGTTREYTNYKEEETRVGVKTVTTDYGEEGKQTETSFNDRVDTTTVNQSVTNSGTDTDTTTGYRFTAGRTKADVMNLFFGNPALTGFFEQVYDDIDQILTLPIFA